MLSPSREYFADLRSEREQSSARRRTAMQSGKPVEPGPEASGDGSAGHPLLASLGRHSREFQEVLEGRTYVEPDGDLFEDPAGACLLHQVQSDMLALCDRGGSSGHPRITLDPADQSIMIHACHSAMREVEVLHDQLLALIAEGDLEAHDIIVMTPDITTYAPVIEAVFSQAVGRPRIPFRIADRGVFATHAVVHALDGLLDLFGSRFAASQVLDLLGQDLVRERFGVAVDEVEVLRDWVKGSGIRWGVDAEHSRRGGQPARAENTWRFGLARLALGYASGAGAERMLPARLGERRQWRRGSAGTLPRVRRDTVSHAGGAEPPCVDLAVGRAREPAARRVRGRGLAHRGRAQRGAARAPRAR